MGMYAMSPRSFKNMNKKLSFLQKLCQGFFEKLISLCEEHIDLMDQIFMIESPEINFKNPLISINEVQRYKIRYKDEFTLQELHNIWL